MHVSVGSAGLAAPEKEGEFPNKKRKKRQVHTWTTVFQALKESSIGGKWKVKIKKPLSQRG